MPAAKQIPSKTCGHCGKEYWPESWKRYYARFGACSKSCSMFLQNAQWTSRTRFTPATAKRASTLARKRTDAARHASLRARLLKAKQKFEAIVVAQYGELSVREIELFRIAHKHGYQRGYNAGYRNAGRDPSRVKASAA